MNTYVTGSTIRQLREAKGLTQAELAGTLSVSAKTISKWETAKGLPDISLLEPLAAALGVSVLELMQGEPIINRNRAANLLFVVDSMARFKSLARASAFSNMSRNPVVPPSSCISLHAFAISVSIGFPLASAHIALNRGLMLVAIRFATCACRPAS